MTHRVLQVITDPGRRGAQVFAVDLGDALRATGFDVRTVALGEAELGDRASLDVPVLGARRVSTATVRALRRELGDVDVAVAHGAQTLPACALATVAHNTPFVYRQISDSLYWAPTAAKRVRVRVGLWRATRVVALWDGAATTLRTHFGVPATKLCVIANGVVASRFTPGDAATRAAARRQLVLDPEVFVVVYVGALVPEKGVDVAIEAMSRVTDAHLLVVGAGPDSEPLRALAASVAPERVSFAGSLADPQIAYHAADALVLSSRGGDSMPAVVVEAALTGIPAIATPIGALRDMVVPGETGELVPTGDAAALAAAIDGLARTPDAARALGRAARARALEHYTIEPVAAAWARLLEEAIQR